MRTLLLLIMTACVSVGLAAEDVGEEHFVWAIDAQIMPEQMEAFMEAKTANAQLHAEYNFELPYFVFVDNFHVHTVFRLDAFALLDSAPQMFDALDEKTGGRSKLLGRQTAACVLHRSSSIAVYRPDLSYEPENPSFTPDFSQPFYQLAQFFHIKPGKYEEIEALAKKHKAMDEREQIPQGYSMYELACGDGVPAFVVVMTAQDEVSFLNLEKRRRETTSNAREELMLEVRSLITKLETKEGTFVPEASYVPTRVKASAPKASSELKNLEGFVGDWTYKGEQVDPDVDIDLPFAEEGIYAGKFTAHFVLDGSFLETKWQDSGPSGAMSGMYITGYDEQTKKYTQRAHISDGTTSVRAATLDGRIWTTHSTMTTPKGEKVLVRDVVKYAHDWTSYTSKVELSVDKGKTWKHWWKERGKKVGKQAAAPNATRQDFEEFCRLHEGRWVCDITWAADWPGLGKKGDTVTAYIQWTIEQDGHALTGKFHGGNGSDTRLVSFDTNAKQIKSMLVGSSGYVEPAIIYKSGGGWVVKGTGSEADGTESEFVITLTFTDNDNTLTVKGTVWVGDKVIDIPGDVWRRVSK